MAHPTFCIDMRRIATLALLLFAGCGSGPPSSVVPADSTIYVGLSADRAERLLQGVSRDDVEFERDVRPWLGSRAAYFSDGSQSGLVFATEDDDAAEAFGRKATAAGPLQASAVIDGHLVLTSSRELLRAANAAAGGQALADSTALDVAGEDQEELLLATSEPLAFTAGLELYGVLPDEVRLPPLGDGPFAARVRDGRVELSGLAPGPAAPSLEDAPGGAWLAVASTDISADLMRDALRGVDRWPQVGLEGLLRHAGAGTAVVQNRGRLDIGARLVAEVDDESAVRPETVALARALPQRVWTVDLDVSRTAVRFRAARRGQLGPRFSVAVEGGRLTVAIGRPMGGGGLGETERYRVAARRLGGPPTLLVDEVAARLEPRGVLRVTAAG